MADRVVMVSPEQAARERLAEEVAEMKKHPIDEVTAGGRFKNAAGQLVNAEGVVIEDAEEEGAEAADDAEPKPAARKSAAKKSAR